METLILASKLIDIAIIILIVEAVGIFITLVWSITLFLIWLDLNEKNKQMT